MTNAAGGLLGEQRYLPFGAERLTPDIGETDFGFTGQRDLAAVGLMDYNARFYAAGIGRFASPDNLLIQYYPQLLNRYSYVGNNSMIFTDENGSCPKPSSHLFDEHPYGIICIAAFIPVKYSTVVSNRIYYLGDDRGFSADSSSSRFWIWIDAGSGEVINYGIHETCRAFGDFQTAHCEQAREVNTGDSQSEPGIFQPWFKVNKQGPSINLKFGIICNDKGVYDALCALSFKGDITITENQDGTVDAFGKTSTFPNYEGYYWEDKDRVQNLFQVNTFSEKELRSNLGNPSHAIFGSLFWKLFSNVPK